MFLEMIRVQAFSLIRGKYFPRPPVAKNVDSTETIAMFFSVHTYDKVFDL